MAKVFIDVPNYPDSFSGHYVKRYRIIWEEWNQNCSYHIKNVIFSWMPNKYPGFIYILSHSCSIPMSCDQASWASCQIGKLRVAHAPIMPRTFSPPLWVSDTDMHHGTCVTHVPWCITGSLTSCILWSRWRGKRHSRCMRNTQLYVSDKRPMLMGRGRMGYIAR